ncbi:LOW QUALITY PROTEIN: hypothetical protein RJ640_016240 [Escallonia rubra]|uniref:NAC domain-containing protein n=1 Tax=Escallonia rubra TaxID=112253 RepID=A0AA88SD83_9ASTE|nr:LOW QUALITY PROTEIN: hypothetical protein RJ640_016240 [Escallonia rubra]
MERLPAGFRFDPTDDEVLIYLSCKVSGNPLPCHGCVTEGDIYDEKQLHQIFSQIKRGGGRPEYFFTQLKKKGKEGCKRFDRTVGNYGNWHATQTKKILDQSGKNVAGFLKSFAFKGHAEDHWHLAEFSLSNKIDCVLCRIKNNKKRKLGDSYDDNNAAAVPVPVLDLEPVTKAAKHDQFLTASTSYYLNNSREEDAPLIAPASCSILPPPISSGQSLTDCGTNMGKDDNAVWDDIQNPLAVEGGAFDLMWGRGVKMAKRLRSSNEVMEKATAASIFYLAFLYEFLLKVEEASTSSAEELLLSHSRTCTSPLKSRCSGRCSGRHFALLLELDCSTEAASLSPALPHRLSRNGNPVAVEIPSLRPLLQLTLQQFLFALLLGCSIEAASHLLTCTNSFAGSENEEKVERGKEAAIDENECLKWLDSKKPNSVIYICFGSVAKFTNAQLYEMLMGLEASGQQSIWVIRREKNEESDKWQPLLHLLWTAKERDSFSEENQRLALLWAKTVDIIPADDIAPITRPHDFFREFAVESKKL